MKSGAFRVSGGLGEKELRLILDDVHALLGEVGLEIDHPALVRELTDHEGVSVKNGRVRYSEELVERARSQVSSEDMNYIMQKPGRTAFELRTPFSPFEVLDSVTGARRAAAERDVVEGARLFDALGASGPVHVHVAAMDPRTAQVEIARLCCENSRAVGNWAPAFSYDQAMCVRDMYAAAGRPEPWVALQMTHSPMRLDAYYLDILMRARSSPGGTRGMTAGGGAMPQPGVSSPVCWRAAAAQGLAEALGAWVTVKLIDPSVRPYASFTTSVTDMTSCVAWSRAPESLAFALLTRQVMRELLGTVEGEYIAPRQEESARSRCMGELYLWALQGARIFGGAGLRRGAFSAPHVVIDREKLAYLEAAVAGVEFPDEPRLAARIMAENLPETSFLMHETTLRFREIHWEPVMFRGMAPPVLAGMLCEDSDELLPRARELARDLAESNPFRLDDAAAREVRRIYERGVRALTGG